MVRKRGPRIAARQIILFGSYAHGTPTDDSDVDVLVVMSLARGRRDVRQAAAIRHRVPAPFPMDVIVRSPQQIARRLADGDGFIAGVLRYGQMMYESDARVSGCSRPRKIILPRLHSTAGARNHCGTSSHFTLNKRWKNTSKPDWRRLD